MSLRSRRSPRSSSSADSSSGGDTSRRSPERTNSTVDVSAAETSSETPVLDGLEAEGTTHSVGRGENLTVIARKYGVSVKDIVEYNGLTDPNGLAIGQSLMIPAARMQVAEEVPGEDVHFVRRGENLSKIAKKYGVEVAELAKANGITDTNFINVGQPLKIPGMQVPRPTARPTRPNSSPRPTARPDGIASAGSDTGITSAGSDTGITSAGSDTGAREQTYTVKSGDALARIAKQFGVDLRELTAFNGIRNANRLSVGQIIRIPGATSSAGSEPVQDAEVSQEVAEVTELESGAVDGADVQNSPALDAIVRSVLRVAPGHSYAKGAIPGILRQCASSGIRNANKVAYILATADHESDFGKPTFNRSESLVEDSNPVRERGGQLSSQNHVSGRRVTANSSAQMEQRYWDEAYGGKLGNRRGTSDASDFKGRGYVQLTGRVNYQKMTKELNKEGFTYELGGVVWGKDKPIDLVGNPTHVNENKELAARCLVEGMDEGLFTGSSLGQHVNDRKTDFYNARSVVNGDKRKNGRSIERTANQYARALGSWSSVFRQG